MSRKRRIEIIKEIERKRKSRLLVYVTGDRQGAPEAYIAPDVLPIIAQHIRDFIGEDIKKLDLFLYSRGGHSDTPWSIVTLVREYLNNYDFGVLIPFRAHSAATVIAIGADEIVMTPMAELGPIDATIRHGPHNPRDPSSKESLPMSVEEVRGYMDMLKTFDINSIDQRMHAFSDLVEHVPPLGLGAVSRLLSQTKRIAENLLRMRHTSLTDDDIKKIVGALASEISSHSHSIRRSEARKIGIDFVVNAEDANIHDELLQLLSEYTDLLQLNSPFDGQGELITEDIEEKTWEDQKLAVVESVGAKHVFKTNIRITRLRQVPPQIAMDFSNLQLSVPPIPNDSALDANEINNYLQNMMMPAIQTQIQEATDRATNQLIKSLPQKGFQTILYRTAWYAEEKDE